MVSRVAFTVRLNEELYDRLKAVAQKEQRSINNTIEFLLTKSINEIERKDKRGLSKKSDR